MPIRSLPELDRVRRDCRALVNRRALLAGAGAAIPLPGVDIVVDVGILSTLVPEISRRFGLTPEQVDELDEATKLMVFEIIRQTGAKLAARTVTKEMLTRLLMKVGARSASKQAARFVPIIGQVVSAGIGFAALKYLGDTHINECYRVVEKMLARQHALPAPAAKAPKPKPRRARTVAKKSPAPRRRGKSASVKKAAKRPRKK